MQNFGAIKLIILLMVCIYIKQEVKKLWLDSKLVQQINFLGKIFHKIRILGNMEPIEPEIFQKVNKRSQTGSTGKRSTR